VCGLRRGVAIALTRAVEAFISGGQRRSNKNTAQRASSGKDCWNSASDRAIATGGPSAETGSIKCELALPAL
jgi:hypothetical protein